MENKQRMKSVMQQELRRHEAAKLMKEEDRVWRFILIRLDLWCKQTWLESELASIRGNLLLFSSSIIIINNITHIWWSSLTSAISVSKTRKFCSRMTDLWIATLRSCLSRPLGNQFAYFNIWPKLSSPVWTILIFEREHQTLSIQYIIRSWSMSERGGFFEMILRKIKFVQALFTQRHDLRR